MLNWKSPKFLAFKTVNFSATIIFDPEINGEKSI